MAGVCRHGNGRIIPPHPFGTEHINEWGAVYSHQSYQLFTPPPPPLPPPGFLFCQICLHASKLASASDHLSVAVIFSPEFFNFALIARTLIGGQVLQLQPQCLVLPSPLRLLVQLALPMRFVDDFAKTGGVTETTFMLPL